MRFYISPILATTAEGTRKEGSGESRTGVGGAGGGREHCACARAQVACLGLVRAWPRRLTAASAGRFRIKEEWNFVAECRRKGIPQAAYCRNGFVDTGVRLLEKIERNSLVSRSSPSKAGDKGSSPFVFELSGEQWKVSRGVPVSAASGG